MRLGMCPGSSDFFVRLTSSFAFVVVVRFDVVGFRCDVVGVRFDVVAVLTAVHPAVGYAFGATKGVLQSQDPFGIPGLLVVRALPPSKPRRSRSCIFAFLVEHGPLPLVISSQDTVLVAVVGSVTGANQARGVRFIETFAETGDRRW